MNTLKENLYIIFGFLENECGFEKTENPILVISDWLISGVAFTNHKLVVVISNEYREKMLSVIIYKIQPDYVIPINNEENYFSLDKVLYKKNIIKTPYGLSYYGDTGYGETDNLKDCIELSASLLKKHIDEILSS
jgi:hypothetical protein